MTLIDNGQPAFILDEEQALHTWLQGMTVTDQSQVKIATKKVNNKSLTSNVATLTTATPHKFSINQFATVALVDSIFNGYWQVTAVPTPTTFSYALTHADIASTPITAGTATVGALRSVGVWYSQPDQEIRQQEYPYITIDMVDISEDVERNMRGRSKPSYMVGPTIIGANTTFDPTLHDWDIPTPIPVNLDYQVTSWSRHPFHDRQILAQLMYNKLPLRFAVLAVGNNDAQGTLRRIDILDVAKRDITEAGKRLMVNVFTIRISSEIAPQLFNEMYKALSISVTGTDPSHVPGPGEFSGLDSFTISA